MSLILRTLICLISFAILSSPAFARASASPKSFASAEHIIFGDKVKLYIPDHRDQEAGLPLILPNGLSLTYGDIIALGDYYGTPSEPIAFGQTPFEREERFLMAFSYLGLQTPAVTEAPEIVAIMHEERKTLEDGMKNGEKPEDIYKKMGSDGSRKINCITGGGCAPTIWWLSKGRSLQLEETNYDHFSKNAVLVYQTGHKLAIEEALAAHATNDTNRLALAYAMNAFACHFLSDLFSAGHMRTPREALPAHVTPSSIGNILVALMHSEESAHGIHVHNGRGNHWFAYGDRSYFNPDNTENASLLMETLQHSADQITQAYLKGDAGEDTIQQLIPEPDELGNASNKDLSPLFYWDNSTQQLMRRQDLANPNDKHWTASWWGWSTLVALGMQRELPMGLQAMLIREKLGKEALRYGLITDKDMIAYLKS